MKNTYIKLFTTTFSKKSHILIFFFISSLSVFSQELTSQEAEKRIPGCEKLRLNRLNQSIQFFELKKNSKIKAENLETYLSETLKLESEIEVKLFKVEKDQLGIIHNKYHFYYKNIKIEDFVYIIHIQNGFIISANGQYILEPNFNSNVAKISSKDAIEIGKNQLKSEKYFWGNDLFPQPELVYCFSNNQYHLSYKTDIYSLKPLNRKFYYVDSENGQIIKETEQIHHTDVIGSAQTKYSGTKQITTNQSNNTFSLNETGRGGGINTFNLNSSIDYSSASNFTDSDNNWNSTANQDDVATDVHFGTEATYDYYLNTFNRNSFDDYGAQINSYVHYDYDFVNAFWDGMNVTYGDGDGVDYSPLTSLEVVGHELTHAVTQYSAGLEYMSESGALNESFSDIFGVIIDFENNPSTANYLIGDQFNITGSGFRSMSNPKIHGDPDTYEGINWVTDPEIDNGGVHTNSGVQNYWFYLLVNGGSGINDLDNNYSVSEISMDDAAAIAYRTLTIYLTPYSQYYDAREYSIQSATDLFGDCSPQVIAVTNAWYAVGIGNQYSNAVTASFYSDKMFSCVAPSTFNFTNQSINTSTFSWNFGDNTTSNLQSPSHTYNSAGTYTVTLIATGTSLCNTSDTFSISNIVVNNSGGILAATCSPSTSSLSSYYGITNVVFNSINHNSNYSLTESYQDNTCTIQTTVTSGNSYPMSFSTGQEYGYVWIDYNNNGVFESNEKVYDSQFQQYLHESNIMISGNSVFNTPLRMRIGSSYYSLNNACSSPMYGQYEDYALIILPNLNPPDANFIANTTSVSTNTPINFTDLSLNTPTSWTWYFQGGTPSTSVNQNPTVSYSSNGLYTVKLVVHNSFGGDSLTKTAYININDIILMCDNTFSNQQSGRILDSGGENGTYQDGENCTYLISPTIPDNITLTINSFMSEGQYDYLYIYDGTDANSPLLGELTGMNFLPTYVATSGSMFLMWYSDGSVVDNGWDVSWNTPSNNAGGIIHSDPTYVNSIITFYSIETNMLNYSWDFGDGNNSYNYSQTTHAYSNPGTYIVHLSYTNAFGVLKNYYDTLTIISTASLEEKDNSLSVYPNPTKDQVIIKNNKSLLFEKISLTNALGEQLIEFQFDDVMFNEKKIDLSQYSTGVYFMKFYLSDKTILTERIIKN